jgi:hypothetical protein
LVDVMLSAANECASSSCRHVHSGFVQSGFMAVAAWRRARARLHARPGSPARAQTE